MAFPAKARTRTTPTVKPLVTMNKKNIQSWELKLGLPQLVVLIGVLTGSMACAFGIGYVTGQRIGFENALASSVSSLPKYPIANSGVDELDSQDVRDVYAELEAKPFDDVSEQAVDEELPDLEAVKTAKEEPVVDDLVVDLLEEDSARDAEKELAEKEKEDVQVRVLGEPAGSDSNTTLGSLVPRSREVVPSDETHPGTITAKTDPILKRDTQVASLPSEMAKISAVKPELPVAELDKKVPPVVVEKPKEEVIKIEEPVEPETNSRVDDTASESRYLKLSLPRGWYAQVAAPQGVDDANSLASKLGNSGFPVVVERATVRGQTYYRVLVGPEENRQQGEILLDQVKRERYLSGQPFIRMVK